MFVALGLTIELGFIFADSLWWQGLVLAVILGFVVRPLVVLPLLLPADLSRGERLFVTFAGLKGAVPILLASLAVVGGTEQSKEIYGIVFVDRAVLGRRPGNARPDGRETARRADDRRRPLSPERSPRQFP